jgi:hypothetical protein
VPSIKPTVGKFCTPEADRLDLPQKLGHQAEWVRSAHTGENGRLLDDRENLRGHLHHDAVGITIGHEACQRSASGHAISARIVDDDQVGAAGFGTFGGKAGPGPAQ